jgi:ATP-dependent Clp protease protease subunit
MPHFLAAILFLALTPFAVLADDPPKPSTPPPAPAPAPAPVPAAPPAPTVPNPITGQPTALPDDPAITEARKELAKLALERDRLMAENAIAKEKLTKELADRRMELERQTLRMEEMKGKVTREIEELRLSSEKELAALKAASEKTTLENTLAKAKSELRMTEIRMEEAEARREISKLSVQIETKDKQLTAAQYAVSAKPVYLENPCQDNNLIISDRRIALNGPIVAKTADQIAERIDYYNNLDPKLPIFIVIDNSPGGSVMAGYKILRAMDGSKAPVYVVVKQFAASMAACITTLADKSFAYPNAQILHHQLSGMSFGNLTQQREGLKETEEWWRRLAGPIAQKMGLSPEDFIKTMYSKVSTGDWTEFGDNAQKLKWVDVVVNEIQETSVLKHPDLAPPPAAVIPRIVIPTIPGQDTVIPLLTETLDEKGRPFMMLPRPNPKDVYYLYNPDGYYRVP